MLGVIAGSKQEGWKTRRLRRWQRTNPEPQGHLERTMQLQATDFLTKATARELRLGGLSAAASASPFEGFAVTLA